MEPRSRRGAECRRVFLSIADTQRLFRFRVLRESGSIFPNKKDAVARQSATVTSMARKTPPDPASLIADSGVLDATPTIEVFGFGAVAATGGVAILPRRGEWLNARGAGVPAVASWHDVPKTVVSQAVVHLQKGRAATWQGLSEAWSRLETGGRLLLVGGNELGIKSAVKRLSGELEQPAEILSNRARVRVACWRREGKSSPEQPVITPIQVFLAGDRFELRSSAGVFSADGVDPGTALLLEHLDDIEPPTAVFDPGCGLGVLGLAALRRWPHATASLADTDHRAVECTAGSAADLDLAHRCDVAWWDATRDPAPSGTFDLVLVNPPFHSGVPVDLQPARAIFRAIDAVLVPGGRALVVANRTLPWEHDLRALGHLRQLEDSRGYKILELTK